MVGGCGLLSRQEVTFPPTESAGPGGERITDQEPAANFPGCFAGLERRRRGGGVSGRGERRRCRGLAVIGGRLCRCRKT